MKSRISQWRLPGGGEIGTEKRGMCWWRFWGRLLWSMSRQVSSKARELKCLGQEFTGKVVKSLMESQFSSLLLEGLPLILSCLDLPFPLTWRCLMPPPSCWGPCLVVYYLGLLSKATPHLKPSQISGHLPQMIGQVFHFCWLFYTLEAKPHCRCLWVTYYAPCLPPQITGFTLKSDWVEILVTVI